MTLTGQTVPATVSRSQRGYMLPGQLPEATMKLSHNCPSLNPFPCPSFSPTRPSWPRCGTLMTWQRKPTHRLMLTIRELHSDCHLHAQRTIAIQQEGGRQHRASGRSTATAIPTALQGSKPPSRQWRTSNRKTNSAEQLLEFPMQLKTHTVS